MKKRIILTKFEEALIVPSNPKNKCVVHFTSETGKRHTIKAPDDLALAKKIHEIGERPRTREIHGEAWDVAINALSYLSGNDLRPYLS